MTVRTPFLLASLTLLSSANPPGTPVETTSVQTPATTPEQKLAALIARYQKQDSEAYDAWVGAKTEVEKQATVKLRPGKEYVPEFRAIAEEARGTETAVRAWLWVLRLMPDDPKESMKVVELLLSEHMDSEGLGELTQSLREPEALRAIVAESPHAKVRAGALLQLGQVLLEKPKAELKAEGRDCLEAVMAEYGELGYGQNSTYGKAAERTLYEFDHLQIGMVAPDFEATDENGVKWKLSDYRGKVVVVDFWGYW